LIFPDPVTIGKLKYAANSIKKTSKSNEDDYDCEHERNEENLIYMH